jgi:hypothetical protein
MRLPGRSAMIVPTATTDQSAGDETSPEICGSRLSKRFVCIALQG